MNFRSSSELFSKNDITTTENKNKLPLGFTVNGSFCLTNKSQNKQNVNVEMILWLILINKNKF